MNQKDIRIAFHKVIEFKYAAMILWSAVRLDMNPIEFMDFFIGENLILNSNKLAVEDKATAFDFLAETNHLRQDVAAILHAAESDGPRDLLLCWLVVISVVYGGNTKSRAIELAASVRHLTQDSHCAPAVSYAADETLRHLPVSWPRRPQRASSSDHRPQHAAQTCLAG